MVDSRSKNKIQKALKLAYNRGYKDGRRGKDPHDNKEETTGEERAYYKGYGAGEMWT